MKQLSTKSIGVIMFAIAALSAGSMFLLTENGSLDKSSTMGAGSLFTGVVQRSVFLRRARCEVVRDD